MRSPWFLSLFMVGLSWAAALPIGAAEESFGEVVEVRLVDVEVWVSDREGEPVSGLGPGDFRVQHDGDAVEITHFLEMRNGRVEMITPDRSVGFAPEAEGGAQGHLILYFDQLQLHPRSYGPLIESLLAFLKRGEIAPQRVLVLRQDRRLYIEVPFGSTGDEIAASLTSLAVSDSRSVGLDTTAEQALGDIRLAWEQAESQAGARAGGSSAVPTTAGPPSSDSAGGGVSPQAAVGGAGGIGLGPDACDMFLSRVESMVDDWARIKSQRIAISLDHLSQTGVFLAALPGVKTFLYLSDGLEAQPGAAFSSYIGSLCPTGSTSAMMSALLEEVSRSMARLTRHLNSNRITLYSLQAAGLMASSSGSAATAGSTVGGGKLRAANSYEASQRLSERDGLTFLARETGGRAIFNQNRLDRGLAAIGRDMGSYYSLAYAPPSTGPGREHRIVVELRDLDHEIRFRTGFLEKDEEQWFAERLEGALNLGLVDNPLDARLGAGKLQRKQDGSRAFPLHIFVPVDSLTFLEDDEGESARISLQILARHLESQKVETLRRRFRARRNAESSDERLGFAVELQLAPGSHALAVGLQDEITRVTSFVTTSVEIPDEGSAP